MSGSQSGAPAASAANGANKKWSNVKWGDVEDQGDGNDDGARVRSPTNNNSSPAKQPDGIRVSIEYYTNDKGQKVKVTRTLKATKKQVRVSKTVAERRKWQKFGDCAQTGSGPGPEANVTYRSTEVIRLDLRPRKREDDQKDDRERDRDRESSSVGGLDKLNPNAAIMVCRLCGETGHWTLKCPKRSSITPHMQGDRDRDLDAMPNRGGGGSGDNAGSAAAGPSSGNPDKYIPVFRRAGAAGANAEGVRFDRYGNDEATLRVSNLSEDTTEMDLSDLFRKFGQTLRIYLAKDRLTGRSRGFAFINYARREDAQKALEKLNGYGYGNLILQIEWAKPREQNPNRDERDSEGRPTAGLRRLVGGPRMQS